MKKIHFLFLFSIPWISQAQTRNIERERLDVARQMENSIQTELLNKWYPKSMDTTYGGFISTYTYDFKPIGKQDKFIVTQSRHIWTTAKASALYPEKTYYLECAGNGYRFLRDKMWDKTYGGFYNLVTRDGKNISNPLSPKDAYGNAFAIYALAAYYKVSQDTGALSLAKKTFFWLEKYAHDSINQGYYQHLKRDGTKLLREPSFPIGSEWGYKDQNSSIHLLEALTELYKVWPDKLVGIRLKEMLYLIRDKITSKKGYLNLFFTPNWKPVSFRDSSEAFILRYKNLDHVSFGHDVETAFLMLEASEALGLEDEKITWLAGKKMVNHALLNGWDNTLGGFYDEGFYYKNKKGISILVSSKNWWAQAEGLNTLLLMANHFPEDPMHYYKKFTLQWTYIQTYLIDHVQGDWYEEGLDKEPERKTALKGHIWKSTYHNFRSLAACVKQLRSMRN